MRAETGDQAAHVVDDPLVPRDAPDVRAVLESGPDWRKNVERHSGAPIPWAQASFAPLVPRPEKIIAVGWNYMDHIAETKAKVPEYPALFTKFARSLIGAYDPIAMPKIAQLVDSEIELD